jgi:hypothetical protein
MYPGFDFNVMADWASWRLSRGNQLVGRLIVDADSRAISWLMAWRLADIVGSAAVTITMGAAAGLALRRSGHSRWRTRPRHRTSSSDCSSAKGIRP